MCNRSIIILSYLFIFFINSIQGNFEDGYSEIIADYGKVLTSLDKFRDSRDELCKEFEEYDQIKMAFDNFSASKEELCKNKQIHKDCSSIKQEHSDATDGLYRIKPKDGKPSFIVYCDMSQQGGGWLVIQRRQDGSEDFYRTWFEYMDGFGNLTGEFWLGNEKIHRLTSQANYRLRVDLEDAKGARTFAEYTHFRVGNMSEFYNLTISGYSGNADDWLTYHNTMRFSAKNLDLDKENGNCAQNYHGAWWYKNCHDSNLNGLYTSSSATGVRWGASINRKTTMKIRPIQ